MKPQLITGPLAALTLAGLLAAPALADNSPTTSGSATATPTDHRDGNCPDGFDAGDKAGVRICHGHEGWRLVTTDPARSGAHEYAGTLTTDGKFADVSLIRPENDDSASVDGDGKLNYDFKTSSGIDGVHFRIDGGSEVTFNVSLDGQQLAPQRIWVGDKGHHPKADPFTLHTRKHAVAPAATPRAS